MNREHMHYRLNLAARPFVNLAIPTLVALLALAGIAIFTVTNVLVMLSTEHDTRGYNEELAKVNTDITALKERIDKAKEEIRGLDYKTLSDRITFVNSLITRRSISWTRLFNRLERLAPAQLTMLRIQPAMRGTQIELSFSVSVPRQEVITDFIDRLESSPYFSNVTLVSENRQAQGDSSTWELRSLYRNEE